MRLYRLRFMLLIGFGLFLSNASAQTKILNRLKSDFYLSGKTQAERESILLQICNQYYGISPDTLKAYLTIGEKLITDRSSANYIRLLSFHITYLNKTGKPMEAIALSDSLLNLMESNSIYKDIAPLVKVEKTRALVRSSQNKEAIAFAFHLLEESEKRNDSVLVVQSFILLQWANMELEKNEEANKWFFKALDYTNNEALFNRHPTLFANAASCYNNLEKLDSALILVNRALLYAANGENLTIQANALNIRADIYIKKHEAALAQKDLEDALSVRELLGDLYYVLSDMGQLSYFYASNNQTKKGIELALKGIGIAEHNNQLPKLIYLYSALAENYKCSGQNDKLASTLTILIDLKDSLYRDNSAKAIADLEGKYEYQKNQNTIIEQNYTLSKIRYITVGLIVLIVLIVLLFWSLYKNYQWSQKRKMQFMLNEQKSLSDAAVLSAEEKERKRIAADLHDNLGAHAAAISAGVKYLKDGIHNPNEVITNLDDNASGMVNHLNDTIWVLKNEKLHFTNMADRFKSWLQKLLANYPSIKYHITEEISNDIEFTPNNILHLFLVLKESVNNAIKHSNCTDLSVHFFSGNSWKIVIEDNGTGFDLQNPKHGNGIENMKQRAAECGATIEWQRNEPSGTRIIISGTTIN